MAVPPFAITFPHTISKVVVCTTSKKCNCCDSLHILLMSCRDFMSCHLHSGAHQRAQWHCHHNSCCEGILERKTAVWKERSRSMASAVSANRGKELLSYSLPRNVRKCRRSAVFWYVWQDTSWTAYDYPRTMPSPGTLAINTFRNNVFGSMCRKNLRSSYFTQHGKHKAF